MLHLQELISAVASCHAYCHAGQQLVSKDLMILVVSVASAKMIIVRNVK